MANHRCAVLGKPVAHSLSPVLHNAAYRSLKLDDWLYDKHEVGEDDLDAFLKGLDSTWAGLSLTMPLKKTIQPYGVPENLWAKELKVANTAVLTGAWLPMIPLGRTASRASSYTTPMSSASNSPSTMPIANSANTTPRREAAPR